MHLITKSISKGEKTQSAEHFLLPWSSKGDIWNKTIFIEEQDTVLSGCSHVHQNSSVSMVAAGLFEVNSL